MYEARLSEQQLLNEQQVMEMKMLASQINPHFLYNTLESIRMQALTAGNREVANSIKLLGKSMRYVLENTGTAMVTLKKNWIIWKPICRFRESASAAGLIMKSICRRDLIPITI